MASRFQRFISLLESRTKGFLVLLAAIALLSLASFMALSEYRFIQTSARADGVVFRQDHGKHHVSIRFNTSDGKVIEYGQNGFISFEVGDKVTVLYDPKKPDFDAKVNTIGATWGDTLGPGILGLFFLANSLLMIFRPEDAD